MREKQVLTLLYDGYKNEEIAKQLFLSLGTVKNYISGIYKVIGVKNRTEAILFLKKAAEKSMFTKL
ncbi:response regulator transcription factor [Bacillaceae bacterium SIJ1]|uniref:response regulator transcription factor n=1 Tax=Litoribacterium kuwaitense TaxID=1398745 RepID=UPI0013ED6BD6|nr:LuxR C-terminal-related transcriptional regulator [Litoribacterium kuwaitense]NGP45596.1 response regulator transcription factor [Litoribacterium kuwaitense]